MFDLIIGNPPFNISQKNNKAGTGGNTTLYKTIINKSFKHLSSSGKIVYISPKSIFRTLKNKIIYFNLMDDIDVWQYDTCFFVADNNINNTIVDGGECKNIFTMNEHEMFDIVYFSGSDRSMDKYFTNGSRKVIRRLPGKNNRVYDYTNMSCDNSPKFAATVLESKKSYTATNEPIFGGALFYIKTSTLKEAQKLKLFTEVNPYFKKYTECMNSRSHAFSLRSVKRFDLNQIETGYELPAEWNLTGDIERKKLNKVQNELLSVEYNNEKHNQKNFGEIFTPIELVVYINDKIENLYPDSFNINKYIIDPCCGNGQFMADILYRRLKKYSFKESLQTLFGIDINVDNVVSTIKRLYKTENVKPIYVNDYIKYKFEVDGKINNNFICADSTKVDYSILLSDINNIT